MDPVTIDLACEIQEPTDSVRGALQAEIANLAADLGLELNVNVSVRAVPEGNRSPRLYIDGAPIDSNRLASDGDVERGLLATLHAGVVGLVTPRLVDHVWAAWGGGPRVAPDDFGALLRRLVRYRIRPDRISHAVPTWTKLDPLELFEEALAGVPRKVIVYVSPGRLDEAKKSFIPGKDGTIDMMGDGLFYELGMIVGESEPVADETLHAAMRIRINDVRSPPLFMMARDECLVNDTVDRLTLLNIKGREAINPANGSECAFVPSEYADICEQAGLTTWDSGGWIILTLSAALRQAAAATLSSDVLEWQMNKLAIAFPYLVEYVRNGIGERRFGGVMRHLLEEEISIRNMRHIIDSLATIPPVTDESIDLSRYIVFTASWSALRPEFVHDRLTSDPATVEIAEAVRATSKRYISHKYTRGGNTLVVYLLDSKFEERMRLRRRLTRAEREWLLEAVGNEVGNLPPTAQNPCVLTTLEIRRRVWSLVGGRFPHLAVLSYQELSPDMNIQPISRISPEGDPPEGPIDLVDRAMMELRYDDAQELVTEAVEAAWPGIQVESRLEELLFFWNEAGGEDRVADNLAWWPEQVKPEQEAVRTWLAGRDPVLFRRLQALYRPGADDLVHVAGGRFTMGDPAEAKDVDLGDFAIAPQPVTGRQYALYLHANGRLASTVWFGADDAVRGVSWREATKYCSWLSSILGLENVYEIKDGDHSRNGFRLPTEAEWEYAARGGAVSRGYRFSGGDRLRDVGDVTGADPVGLRRPNELGLYDMSGGRAEWCAAHVGDGSGRVARGGDVTGTDREADCTVWARKHWSEEIESCQSMNLGFRLARTELGGGTNHRL